MKLTEEDWNEYTGYLKKTGNTVQQDISSNIKQKLTIIRHEQQSNNKTTSAHQDTLTQYVAENYNLATIRPVTGSIHIKLTEPEHRELIETSGIETSHRIISAVHNAIYGYWIERIAQKRIPTDEAILQQRLDDIAGNAEKSEKTLLKQEISKITLSGKTQGFFKAVQMIKVTWGCPIIPKVILSKLTESDLTRVIQFDCSIIGPSQKKIDTESKKYIQKILVQEIESESLNYNPMVIKCTVHGDSTSNLASGQRKRILGRYQVEPTVEGQKATTEKHLIIDAFDVRDAEEQKEITLSRRQLSRAHDAASDDESDYLQQLINSFCPKIYGRDLEKTCIDFGFAWWFQDK